MPKLPTYPFRISRILLLTLFLANQTQLVISQPKNNIDSLVNVLTNSENDTSKVHTYNELARAYAMAGQYEKAMEMAQEGLALAKAVEFKRGEIRSHISVSNILGLEGNYPENYQHLEEALETSREISDKRNEAIILNNLALKLDRIGDYEKAIEYAKASLDIYEKMDDKFGMGGPLQILGAIYESQGRYEEASAAFSRAQKAWEEAGHTTGVANILSSFGVLNSNLGNFEEALNYHQQYVEMHQQLGNKHHLIDGYLDVGGAFIALNQPDSALSYFQKAIDLQKELNIDYATGMIFNDMGKALIEKGEFSAAIVNFEKALDYNESIEDHQEIISSIKGLSDAHYANKDYKKAIFYASKGLELVDSSKHIRLRFELSGILAKCYAATDQFEQAYLYQKKESILRDSLFNMANAQTVAEMNSKFEVEKKEQRISILENGAKLAELQRNVFLGSAFFIIVVIFLLFNQQRIRNKKNRLLLKKEKEVDQVKSRFFANISHEFRTPLTLILGPIEEIKEKISDHQSQLYLGLMQKNAKKLLNQVNQLLDLSKLDSGQLKLHVEEGDMVAFVKSVTMCFESLAFSRKIELTFSTDQEKCDTWFDKDCIEKIIVNLLSNAFKFTEDSGRVSVKITEKVESSIEIVISDTGRGIEAHELDKIFERYYYTESERQAGSGIGLALVKELVESHHGSITAQSEKNEGSSFKVILPLGKEHWKDLSVFEGKSNGQASPPIETDVDYDLTVADQGSETSRLKKTVLIIEDNDDVRLFIKETLKTEFNILEENNGTSGIEKGETHIPDLIITDIMMDGIDGYEVASRLKQSEKTSHIPVIMLTAKADAESKIKGLQYEADDFITKPFERKELLARISNLINNREKLKEKFNGGLTIKSGNIEISSVDQTFIEKLLVAIEENIDNNTFGVEELAGIASMSRSQLHRKLQAIAGQAPNQFIRNIRLDRAMELLKNNAGTVAEISYMTGFTSPNYFSKCFNDKYGHAPGEVRKNTP